MSRAYYHGTTASNLLSIQRDGEIHTSMEGIVYCCETAEDCLKFASIRTFGTAEDIVILKIDVPDDIEVEETFDHAPMFFQCRCWGICCPVPYEWIDTNNSSIIRSPFKKEEKHL